MKRTLCIRLPDWPLQRITRKRPELNRKPIVLYETCGGSRRVAVCSAEARALGVTVGMPSAEAVALAGSTPLYLEAYDPSADREALEALAVYCGRFSPLVGLDDSAEPDSLLLDITGLEHLFGSEASLAAAVVDDFARRRLAVRVAVADTIGAAWAVAHFGLGQKWEGERRTKGLQIEDCRLKTAHGCDPAIPQSSIFNLQSSICNLQFAICNSQSLPSPSAFIIPPGEVSAALRPLPVEALRLEDDVVELLHQLGIYRIGQLESLPRAELTARFGPRLLERWDQATGRLAEPIPAQPRPPELSAGWSLEHPTTRRETIELAVEQLVGRVARMLVRCGRGAVRLECRLDCPPARGVDLCVGLFQPTAAPRHLFELVRMQLERVLLPGPVSAVHVRAAATAPFEPWQPGLFADGRGPHRPRRLAGLVDRLTSRLGRHFVLRAHLVSDAQPELACRYEPLVECETSSRAATGRFSRRRHVGTSSPRYKNLLDAARVEDLPAGRSRRNGWPGSTGTDAKRWSASPQKSRRCPRRVWEAELPPRPLRLLARPVPLAAVSIMPDGPPLTFCLQGRPHRVAHTWGPERIETGWWRGRPVRRDYYRVETTIGRRFWLFRRLDDGRWFLHGTFE